MPKPTIKSLEEQIKTLRELRKQDERKCRDYCSQILNLRGQLSAANVETEALCKDKQWLKQLASEQAASISAYMRSR